MSQPSPYKRSEHLDANFLRRVQQQDFLRPGSEPASFTESGLTRAQFVDLFESQMMSRLLDLRARELKDLDQCYYTIGSSGHEGNAGLGFVFPYTDPALLHYRSGAFMIQRAKQLPGATPIYDNLLSFAASSDDPISGGRHKVFGSFDLNVPPQTSTIASHLPKAVGLALALRRGKDLAADFPMNFSPSSVVLCSFGDASANHATAQAAFNTAALVSYQNLPLPLVFVCEDNGIGISVPTPGQWIYDRFSQMVGLQYVYADGLDIFDVVAKARSVEAYVRQHRKPVFFHVKTVRLMGHAGSDPEWSYQSFQAIEANEVRDPLLSTARLALDNDLMSVDDILRLYRHTKERIFHVSEEAVRRPKLLKPDDVAASITACARPRTWPQGKLDRQQMFGKEFEKLHQTPLHMAKLINFTLADILLELPQAVIFGEDVAQKGGVYNVTDGLYKKFGAKKVFNSPLDETSILGTAMGFAQQGLLPIPEIQFLAYVHNAEDQLRGEASTLSFFSKGQFTNPMVVRVAGLAYQKGFGGHFHNDNSMAVFRDIPGLLLAVPSNGYDAAGMLRTLVKEAYCRGRVAVFLEPIALYMTKDLHQDGDKLWSFPYPQPDFEIPLGQTKLYSPPAVQPKTVVVTYGNGVYHSLRAQKVLQESLNLSVAVLDLRWLSPLPWSDLERTLQPFDQVLIVDECRKTGSPSEGLLSGLYERLGDKNYAVLAAHDSFIPLGPAAAAGLPKTGDIVEFVKAQMEKHRAEGRRVRDR
jgi:2-oxoisovalerate dehydrogenase E1 component